MIDMRLNDMKMKGRMKKEEKNKFEKSRKMIFLPTQKIEKKIEKF